MCHDDAVFVQVGCPSLGTSGRGKDDGYLFIDNDLHDLLDLRIHQGDVDAKRLRGGQAAFPDVFAKDFGMHGAGADQAKPSGIADC